MTMEKDLISALGLNPSGQLNRTKVFSELRLAYIDPNYSGSGFPKVRFYGETTVGARTYPYVQSYYPTAGDAVIVLMFSHSGVILGKILGVGQASGQEFPAGTATGATFTATDGHDLILLPSAAQGSYNGIVNSGDQAIIYSGGSSDSGEFVIAPWSASPMGGIRLNSQGLPSAGFLRQMLLPLSGADGVIAIGSFDNYWGMLLSSQYMYFKQNASRLGNRPTTFLFGVVGEDPTWRGVTLNVEYNSQSNGAYESASLSPAFDSSESWGDTTIMSAYVTDYTPAAGQNLGADFRLDTTTAANPNTLLVQFAIVYDHNSRSYFVFEAFPNAMTPFIPRILSVLYDGNKSPIYANWGSPTYANGYTDFTGSAGYSPVAYTKTPDGVVRIKGMTEAPAAPAAGQTIFALPPGFRPGLTLSFPAVSDDGFIEVQVSTTGAVAVATAPGANAWISLSSISFIAEN